MIIQSGGEHLVYYSFVDSVDQEVSLVFGSGSQVYNVMAGVYILVGVLILVPLPLKNDFFLLIFWTF